MLNTCTAVPTHRHSSYDSPPEAREDGSNAHYDVAATGHSKIKRRQSSVYRPTCKIENPGFISWRHLGELKIPQARQSDKLAPTARLAQSAERKALNLVVVGSSPTVGALCQWPRCCLLQKRPMQYKSSVFLSWPYGFKLPAGWVNQGPTRSASSERAAGCVRRMPMWHYP